MTHLPPIDMRYGWYTGRRPDQTLIVHGLLQVGVMCFFAAPNCVLWGNMVHGMPSDRLTERREREGPALRFLAMCCLLQFLMGRHFMIANSGASQISQASPLSALDQLGLHKSKLDQCMYGAELEGKHIEKNTTIVSDTPVAGLDRRCDRAHEHLVLRGGGPDGSRTASAARYPDPLCNAILTAVKNINKNATPKDGGRRTPSFSFCEPDEFREMNKMEQIVLYLEPLRTVARDHGYEELFENLVDPWVNHHVSGGNPSEKRTGSTTFSAVALTPHQGMRHERPCHEHAQRQLHHHDGLGI